MPICPFGGEDGLLDAYALHCKGLADVIGAQMVLIAPEN